MRNKVRNYIEKNNLFPTSQPVIVGFSGGADSVALLSVLSELGYRCIAAHCNFHLRGDESDRDEAFARDFAASISVPFEKVDFDTEKYAAENRVSIEMAARELRYAWFDSLLNRYGAQAIAVAHHKDDSVETLLLNLVRGTGIRGVSGIQCKNGHIVRPMLCVGRDEIVAWLDGRKQTYVTDSTNLSDEYTRNFIRLKVLPLLKEINPSVKESIFRTSQNLLSAKNIYEEYIEASTKKIFASRNAISIDSLLSLTEPKTILYEALKSYGFNRTVVDDIYEALQGNSGKVFYSDCYMLLKDRDNLIIAPKEAMACKQEYTIDRGVEKIYNPIKLSFENIVLSEDENRVKRSSAIACLDADKLAFPLILRRWKEGDWFIPLGMKGRKKLSDYFTGRKYDLIKKESTWLLCSGNDIVWIVGERIDDRYSIKKSTKNMLEVNFFQS